MTKTSEYSDAAAIRALLSLSRIAFLATEGEYGPEGSMAPYAMFEASPLLHLSGLARHSKNLRITARAGLMICTPEQADASVLALPRLSLQGTVLPVADESMGAAKNAYLKAIPDAAPLFEFPDFRLCMLEVERIYWIGGFGSARELTPGEWQRLFTGT